MCLLFCVLFPFLSDRGLRVVSKSYSNIPSPDLNYNLYNLQNNGIKSSMTFRILLPANEKEKLGNIDEG